MMRKVIIKQSADVVTQIFDIKTRQRLKCREGYGDSTSETYCTSLCPFFDVRTATARDEKEYVVLSCTGKEHMMEIVESSKDSE
jgi:hypothetical protein